MDEKMHECFEVCGVRVLWEHGVTCSVLHYIGMGTELCLSYCIDVRDEFCIGKLDY